MAGPCRQWQALRSRAIAVQGRPVRSRVLVGLVAAFPAGGGGERPELGKGARRARVNGGTRLRPTPGMLLPSCIPALAARCLAAALLVLEADVLLG